MAKMMKKFVAMLSALSLCMSIVALPAAAEEHGASGGETTTVTVEITDDGGNPIGQLSTTITTTSSDTSGSNIQQTDTQKTWNTQQTEGTDPETNTRGNQTVTNSSSVVTDVTGSSQSTDLINSDKSTGIQTYSGTESGSETTTVTDTTTTTTTTTGVLQSDETNTSTTINNKTEEEDWGELQKTGEGQWNSTGTDSDGYERTTDKNTKNNGTTDVDVDNDPLKNNDVTLKMDAPTGSQKSTSDQQELFISIEDALANDISYKDNETLEDGSVVKYKYDTKGNVIGYTITKYTPTSSTNNTQIAAGTSGDPTKSGTENKTYIKPEGYTPVVDEPILDESGNTIGTKTIEEIKDGAGNVIGYTITERVVTAPGNLPDVSTENLDVPKPVRTLPERPIAPDPVTEGGLTTTVIVEDIVENGETVGYKTTKTVTDGDGNEVSSESESIYGTVTSYSSTLTKTPERDEVTTTTVTTVYGTMTTQNYTITTPGTIHNVATRDVTQQIYELVETKDGLFFLFEGKMYKVKAMSGHGVVDMRSVSPQLGLTPSGDGSINENTDLRNPHYNDYVDVSHKNGDVNVGNGYDFKYVGYGLESSITARTNNSNGTLVHQFKLQDEDGNFHYVLCADYSTTAYRDTDYDMKNVADATYYSSEDAKHIQAIVTNGYWGTASGVGSLETVKAFLKKHSNLSDSIIDNLTHGEALTATQAAIWYYGNSGDTQIMSDTKAAKKQYSGAYSGGWLYKNLSDDEVARVDALYQALIDLEPSTDSSTELLSEKNYATEAELTIKDKATENGKVKTDSNGNEKYIADLTFSLDVKKSDLTGNLVVTVTDENGKVIRTEQIATDSSNLVGKLLANGKTSTTEHTYTIKDLELAEGVKFNLNLSGTQNIAQGAYLYSAELYSTSQTFVGLGSGTHAVNLNVQMEFSVTDPEAKVKHTTVQWSEKKEESESFTKTDSYKKEKKGTETNQTVTVNTKIYGTNVQEDVTEQKTVTHCDWRSSYTYQLVVNNGDDGDGGRKKFKKIDDEEVPLADAPKTGDLSVLLLAISMGSAGGMAMLNRKRKDEEQ